MADFAAQLPKWQAQQMLCQTTHSKNYAKLQNIFQQFFYLLFKFRFVEYRYKKQRRKEMIISDCCGVEIVNDIAGLELCPSCWEHCECIVDDSLESDYIPGFDDGEAA